MNLLIVSYTAHQSCMMDGRVLLTVSLSPAGLYIAHMYKYSTSQLQTMHYLHSMHFQSTLFHNQNSFTINGQSPLLSPSWLQWLRFYLNTKSCVSRRSASPRVGCTVSQEGISRK